jgi:processive 1,2-diacylglycerol beta-glucosyltransferase
MRVLIYSVCAGAGHVRAAEALAAAFKRYHPHVETENIDVMKLVPPAFKQAYVDSYLGLVNTLPHVWGWLYSKSDTIPHTSALISIRRFVQKLNTKKIIEHALSFNPDAILTTHFLPAEIFSEYRKKHRSPARALKRSSTDQAPAHPKLAVVVTDHDVHQLWIYPRIDRYYTASVEIAHLLAERAGPDFSIKATGIPCDSLFGELMDQPARQRLRKMLGLDGTPSPTLLLNAHGCGVSGAGAARSLGGVVSGLLRNGSPKTVLVICGRNDRIKEALTESVVVPERSVVKFYGYVNNMHELMGVSDLAVTKPGGLTTSECLARCLPMVLVSPIPGQEERNAEMLLENGCAVLARTPAALAYKLELLLNDSARLQLMRENCRRTGRPHAARDIANDIVELVGQKAQSR